MVTLIRSGRLLTMRVRPPAGGWLERRGRLTSPGSRVGFDGDDTVDASTTRAVAMISLDFGNLGSPQLVDVREACPATPPAGLVCPDPGAVLGVLRGPLFVQPADYTDDYTDAPPLVRLLDGDAVLTAWAAERLVGRHPHRGRDPRRLRAAGRGADPGAVVHRPTRRSALRPARRTSLRASGDRPPAAERHGAGTDDAAPGGTFGFVDLLARAGRVTAFTAVLQAGRHVLTAAGADAGQPAAAGDQRRIVAVAATGPPSSRRPCGSSSSSRGG